MSRGRKKQAGTSSAAAESGRRKGAAKTSGAERQSAEDTVEDAHEMPALPESEPLDSTDLSNDAPVPEAPKHNNDAEADIENDPSPADVVADASPAQVRAPLSPAAATFPPLHLPARNDSGAPQSAIRFVHAADLHLDAVFAGISRDMPQETARRLHQATFDALNNLFALCERVRPDFLLLSGDVYNQEDRSLAAQLAVRDGCARLEKLGVPVFIIHGNHDPLSSRLKTVQWPENVTIFEEQFASRLLLRDDAPLAVIHGASHAGPREARNLAAMCHRTDDACLQIGLLHTSMGESDKEIRYAPCSVEDLKASGLDYWALGHVHERRPVCERPLAQYPGSAQGLHVNEPGPRGCLLVTAVPEGKGFVFSTVFQPLGPVEWRSLDLELTEDSTLDGLEQSARMALAEAVSEAVSSRSRGAYLVMPCAALIARLRLSGRTPLDMELRRTQVIADLLERLRDDSTGEPLVWVKDVEVDTRPLLDRAALAEREDLLGEILRLADRLKEDPDLLALLPETALADLYGHARARKALDIPDNDDLRALLLGAETACLDLLENE